MRSIEDEYVKLVPTGQNILDLFKNEWSSVFPDEYGFNTDPARARLFEDPRIKWIDDVSGGFEGKCVVELGPLEGGHTYQMERLGAASIVAIEANKRAFLKCLCVKEILDLRVSKFLLGDFNEYLKAKRNPFDIAVACGVLYHMREPLTLIDSLCANGKAVFIWSHYFDECIVRQSTDLSKRFDLKPRLISETNHYRYYYQDALTWDGFCGGGYEFSYWLTLESIRNRLAKNGFSKILEHFHQKDHPHGPSISLFCERP